MPANCILLDGILKENGDVYNIDRFRDRYETAADHILDKMYADLHKVWMFNKINAKKLTRRNNKRRVYFIVVPTGKENRVTDTLLLCFHQNILSVLFHVRVTDPPPNQMIF